MNQAHIGQLLFIGIKGPEIDPESKELLTTIQPGGIILFNRNLQTVEQIQSLIQHINSLCQPPPFIAIDQEGGRVQRLQGILPSIPPSLTLANYNVKKIRLITRAIAQILWHLGINLNFFPVLDVLYQNKNNLIGDRCLSSDPHKITAIAGYIIMEHQKSGIFCCGKHFPGLGFTDVDSHQSLPVCSLSKEELCLNDLFPYKFLKNKLPFIMVGHCHYPHLAPDQISSLSSTIVTDLLITTLEFKGIIITDDLEMSAVTDSIEPEQAVLQALLAGAHLVMLCHRYDRMERAFAFLTKQYTTDQQIQHILQHKIHTLLSFKKKPLKPKLSVPPFDTLISHLTSLL